MNPKDCLKATDFTSIQAAVAALPPEGGDVWVPKGVYNLTEPIIIDRPNVGIIGEPGGGAQVRMVGSDPKSRPNAAFRVTAPGFELRNIHIDLGAEGPSESQTD